MSVYKRGDVWWYKFRFAGQVIRESSKSNSRTVARAAEHARRRQLEESWNQIRRRKLPSLFSIAATDWLKMRTGIAPSTLRSYKLAISHLTSDFGKQLLCDISAEDLAAYQTRRKREGVSNRTVNLELGVLRAILRRYRMWEAISADVDFLKESPSPGRALTAEEETALLAAAQKSRCRSLYPVVMLALNTGMRASEIRGLRWEQVDLLGHTLTVGKSKTQASTGRMIPLNPRAAAVLTHWRGLFPGAQPEHYVFLHEKYGLPGNDRQPCAWEIEPNQPMHRWKVAWESVRKAAGVSCRFHDLRHTFISRLAESQASDSTVMALAGHVSRAMMERYSHIRMEAKRRAVDTLSGADTKLGTVGRSHFAVTTFSSSVMLSCCIVPGTEQRFRGMKRAIQVFSSLGFSWTAFCEKLKQEEKCVRWREEGRCGDLGGSPEADMKPTRKPLPCRNFNRLSKGVFAVLFALAIMRFFGPLHYDPKAIAYRTLEAARVGYNFYKTGDWINPFRPIATGPTAHVAPAFPVLLATIYHIFGEGARGKFAVDLLEATVLTLQVSLLPILARSMGLPLSLGFIAEILAIACVRREVQWEQSYVALLLVIVTIAACDYLRVIERPGTQMLGRRLMAPSSAAAGAAAVGILWGLLLLTGPSTGLVWAGWLAVGAIYSWRCGFRTAWLPALILPLLMLAPWTWRNYRVLGHPVLVRSNLGLELMISNSDCPCGFWKNHPDKNLEEARLVLALGEVNYNRMKFEQTVAWIRQNQREFWWRTWKRFVCFWFPTETGHIRDVLHSNPRNPVSGWVLNPATVLSVPGIFLLWRTHRKAAWLCLSFLMLFPPIYYIVGPEERYRYPITWVTCLVAAYPIDRILRRWQATHEAEPRSQRVKSSKKDTSHDT